MARTNFSSSIIVCPEDQQLFRGIDVPAFFVTSRLVCPKQTSPVQLSAYLCISLAVAELIGKCFSVERKNMKENENQVLDKTTLLFMSPLHE